MKLITGGQSGVDRAAYFQRCWPKEPLHQKFDFVAVAQDGDKVMIAYDCSMHVPNTTHPAARFRNAELMTFRDGKLVATEVFDHAAAGDALAQSILHKSAQTLAYAIYNLAVVLNCPLFVLGGSVGLHPVFWRATQEILEQRDKRVQPKLLRSTLGPDAQVNGTV